MGHMYQTSLKSKVKFIYEIMLLIPFVCMTMRYTIPKGNSIQTQLWAIGHLFELGCYNSNIKTKGKLHISQIHNIDYGLIETFMAARESSWDQGFSFSH